MEQYIPYEKCSKKERRERDRLRRGSWGAVNPVTRKPKNPKAYDRKKTQDWRKELPEPVSFFVFSGSVKWDLLINGQLNIVH